MDGGGAVAEPVRVGVVGVGRIGTAHAELLARHVPGARLLVVADPRPAAADAVASRLGCRAASDPAQLFTDPDIEAVVIAASSEAHTELIVAATAAGKAVFCEKPMGLSLSDIDRAIEAASAAGVALQVGFNRRFSADFAAAHRLVVDGKIGTPQLIRSLTPRAPAAGGADPRTARADSGRGPPMRTGARVRRAEGDSPQPAGVSSRPCPLRQHVQHQPVALVEVGLRHALDVRRRHVHEDVELAVGRGDVVVDHRSVRQMERLILIRLAPDDVVAGELVLGSLQLVGRHRFALQLLELAR